MKKLIFGLSLFLVWVGVASMLFIPISIEGSFTLVDYYFSVFLFTGCVLFTLVAIYEYNKIKIHEKSKTKG